MDFNPISTFHRIQLSVLLLESKGESILTKMISNLPPLPLLPPPPPPPSPSPRVSHKLVLQQWGSDGHVIENIEISELSQMLDYSQPHAPGEQ